ncbi:MAG TPA: tetratricopeptide repeat-containing glycosyltransferase family protein [Tepidisphaeraceae bacterium]|jgi:Flp pilus assembly protein TadD
MDVDRLMKEAQQLHQRGDLRRAEPLYRQVLAERPDHAEALNMLGLVALQCGQPQAAIELMERSVGVGAPAGTGASRVFYHYNNLAEAYKAARRYADAARAFERSLELAPEDYQTRHSLAVALDRAGEHERAAEMLRGLIQAVPDYPKPYMSLGAALEKQARYAEALELLERAVALDPQYSRARHGRAGVWLRYGDFERGWAEYEWRWRVPGFPGRPPRPGIPLWNGEDLGGRTILLYAEQGLGDTIQFIRYVPQVAARGGWVLVETPAPLVRLVRSVEGVSDVVTPEEAPRAYQVQLPLLSLPRVMGTRIETIPNRVPYLAPPADVVTQWAARVGYEPTVKIGLCWAGGRSQPHRSIPSVLMSRIIENAPAGVRFYSLQKDRPAEDPGTPAGVVDLMGEVTDFADTAGLIAAMDRVISIDTAAAHLAGAMGKPTWVMLAHHADWRWLDGREDSPWYPTMRLFKQEHAGDWDSVVERVKDELGAQMRKT